MDAEVSAEEKTAATACTGSVRMSAKKREGLFVTQDKQLAGRSKSKAGFMPKNQVSQGE